MYCSTIITTKSQHFLYFIALLAAKCCCSRQVNKRQAAAKADALLSAVGNVVLEKMCKLLGGPDAGQLLGGPVAGLSTTQ